MGGSSSKNSSPAPTQFSEEGRKYRKAYTCEMINDFAINWVLRDNSNLLTEEELAMGREAQSLANDELNSTMRNCELVVYFSSVDITLQAGECDNRIVLLKRSNGEIEWKFTKRSFSQTLCSGVRSVGTHLFNFFRSAASIASDRVLKMIEYE